MLTIDDIQGCARRLYVYDVDQLAWEQEKNGFIRNAYHALGHLVMTLSGKDFTNPATVRDEIAPDSLHFALRLSRWSHVSKLDVLRESTHRWRANAISASLGNLATNPALFIEAIGMLGSHLQELDHKSSHAIAIEEEAYRIARAAGTLIASAEGQAEEFNFDLVEAFDARLAQLRERFGIPEPGVDTVFNKPDPI